MQISQKDKDRLWKALNCNILFLTCKLVDQMFYNHGYHHTKLRTWPSPNNFTHFFFDPLIGKQQNSCFVQIIRSPIPNPKFKFNYHMNWEYTMNFKVKLTHTFSLQINGFKRWSIVVYVFKDLSRGVSFLKKYIRVKLITISNKYQG